MNFLKQKNKKILSGLFGCVFSICVLSGCSSATKKDVSVKNINEKISKVTNISEMRQGQKEKIEKLYNINSNEIQEFVLYTAPSNIKSEEIAIIKVKDEKDVDNIKDKIEKRVEVQGNNFKDYLPKEYGLIEKHILKSNGKYVLLAISKDGEKIEKVFDDALK